MYSLSAKYPANVNVVFPDSTYNFFPFEFEKKKFFPTQTKEGLSYDSVVYYVSTFEVDSVQSLALPVYIIHTADCTVVEPEPSSVKLQFLVASMPDSVETKDLPLKITVAYEPVSGNFNYIVAGAIVLGLFLMAITVWLVFGKKIKRYFKLKRLRKNHEKFLSEYTLSMDEIKSTPSTLAAEQSVGIWKKYMEQLERKPYTTLTTRETINILHNDTLKQNLQAIDRVIYGHQHASEKPFESLRDFANDQFQQKVKEVQHG